MNLKTNDILQLMGRKINFIGGTSSNNIGSILFPFGEEAILRLEKSKLPGHLVSVRWFKPCCA